MKSNTSLKVKTYHIKLLISSLNYSTLENQAEEFALKLF